MIGIFTTWEVIAKIAREVKVIVVLVCLGEERRVDSSSITNLRVRVDQVLQVLESQGGPPLPPTPPQK